MARPLIPPDSIPLRELLHWSDAECRAVADAIAEELLPRLWAARLTLDRHLREPETSEAARARISGRITAIAESVQDLRSAEAMLNVVDAPVSWKALEHKAS